MAKTAEVLQRILDETEAGLSRSQKAKQIAAKIIQGKATYVDAEEYARESSRILTGSMARNVPKVLTEERLYRAEADEVIKKPMRQTGKKVSEVTADIQQKLNENAEININAIVPELNEDQIDGIITGICNADSYAAGKETLFTQIENFLEGVVDDSVRENADFQYNAGLYPKIERISDGKCCEWCSRLTGTYDYSDVSDRGNDVFRRHKNCHCQVLFNPGDGSKRRQNVYNRKWTDYQDPDIIEQRKTVNLDLQQFGRKGDYRAALYASEWQEASLKETVKKFVQGAKKSENRKKGKVFYDKPNGQYQVVYDRNGNYFRILDKEMPKQKPYVGLNGEPMLNKTIDGRTIGIEDDEYEKLTHFINTDKGNKKVRK